MIEQPTDNSTNPQTGTSTHVPVSDRGTLIRLLGVLFIMIVLFSLLSPGFFSFRNFTGILVGSTVLMLVAIGQLFVVISRGIDLSIGWIVGLSSVSSALTMTALVDLRIPALLAIIVGIGVGLFVAFIPGIINGILITIGKVPPFLATLIMSFVLRGVALLITGQNGVVVLPAAIRDILRGISNGSLLFYVPDYGLSFFSTPDDLTRIQVQGIVRLLPFLLIIVVVMIAGFVFLLTRTNFGLYTYAIGTDSDAVRRSGFNISVHIMMIYILSAITAGLAGILLVVRSLAGSAELGDSLTLGSLAAVLLGGARLSGGVGTIHSTLLAVIVLATLQTGLGYLGIGLPWYMIIISVLILAMVVWQQRDNLR